jgi:excinuclease ABC subunit C
MAVKMQSKNIPQSPGVYFFRNSRGGILYIGKANNLRARIRSYFRKDAPTKAQELAMKAHKLTWETCSTEAEALIRESELIKKHRPNYNILMRDDKQYLYVGFTKEVLPKIFVTHQPEKGADYLGPFTESGSLRTVLKYIRRAFPYCTCSSSHLRNCLNTKIGKCPGICCTKNSIINADDKKQYKKNILAVKRILSGKSKTLISELKKKMRTLSKKEHFEEAARMRNQLFALEHIFEHRGVIKQDMPTTRGRALKLLADLLNLPEIHRIEGYDISNIQGRFAYGSMVVFVDGLPKKDEYRIFKINTVHQSDDPRMIEETVSRRLAHPEWSYPEVILIDGGKTQLNAALSAKSKSKISKLKNIKIVSLAKREEELHIPSKPLPVRLKKSSESLYSLITHIRNESHRFAISHYRKRHRKIAG